MPFTEIGSTKRVPSRSGRGEGSLSFNVLI